MIALHFLSAFRVLISLQALNQNNGAINSIEKVLFCDYGRRHVDVETAFGEKRSENG